MKICILRRKLFLQFEEILFWSVDFTATLFINLMISPYNIFLFVSCWNFSWLCLSLSGNNVWEKNIEIKIWTFFVYSFPVFSFLVFFFHKRITNLYSNILSISLSNTLKNKFFLNTKKGVGISNRQREYNIY